MTALQCVGFELAAHDPRGLARYYCQALAFSLVHDDADGTVDLTLGECSLRLRPARGRPMPADCRSHDRWFRHLAIVVRNMRQANEHIQAFDTHMISSSPQTLPLWNVDSGGIEAFYFRDPEGHPLELIHFPEGKGRPQWHAAGDDLFQGVDHSAIVVSDTEASLAFYNRIGGLAQASLAHNYGAEQERLTAVEGADLYATRLGGADGAMAGLELLEYRNPLDGRLMPADTHGSDAWWSSTLLGRGPASFKKASQPTQEKQHLDEYIDPDGYRVIIL